MGRECLRFGTGPKELGGSIDLISHYRLWPHHEFFCKKSLPPSISETHYLTKVVGDRQIRKGEGMELDQLFQDATVRREENRCIHPFRLDVLADVFHIRETAPVNLSSPDRGTPTAVTKSESKLKERHHKKHKDKDKHKSKNHKKRKHRSKDKGDSEVREQSRNGPKINGSDNLKHQEKRRRLNGSTHHGFAGIRDK